MRSKIYKKIDSVSSDYAGLAEHVKILHTVLYETQAFLSNDNVPPDQRKRRALDIAGESCSVTLAELEEFLDKYSSLGKNKKRLVELLKFITKDVEGFKSKLKSNADLLQICLISLTRYVL